MLLRCPDLILAKSKSMSNDHMALRVHVQAYRSMTHSEIHFGSSCTACLLLIGMCIARSLQVQAHVAGTFQARHSVTVYNAVMCSQTHVCLHTPGRTQCVATDDAGVLCCALLCFANLIVGTDAGSV